MTAYGPYANAGLGPKSDTNTGKQDSGAVNSNSNSVNDKSDSNTHTETNPQSIHANIQFKPPTQDTQDFTNWGLFAFLLFLLLWF